jgi:hypothetical protein
MLAESTSNSITEEKMVMVDAAKRSPARCLSNPGALLL